jgi:uncharacterized repeat protein (TIGR03803 family)
MPNKVASAVVRIVGTAIACMAFTVISSAQPTEQILYSFTGGLDGGEPQAGLVVDSKGNLFGTSSLGGTSCCGTVFELSPTSNGTWTEQVIYSFTGGANPDDGFQPYGGLAFDAKGNLYGTTIGGGSSHYGTVFELSPGSNGTWSETILYSFSGGSDGGSPLFGVTPDASGNLYGTTNFNGPNGFGIVFELTKGSNGTWSKKTIYSFEGKNDGGYPYGSLIIDGSGNLYGAAQLGGAHDYGAIFELSQSNGVWKEKAIHAFTGAAGGSSPLGSLAMDKAGNLYTEAISAVLELTPGPNGIWTAKNIHTFIGGSDGAEAQAGLILDNAGNVYGMTYSGGVHRGTVFELTPGTSGAWTETILHRFTGGNDGLFPEFSDLAVDAEGKIYGTTPGGGAYNFGVVFEVKP